MMAGMVGVRVTTAVARVCAVLLTEPDRRWYGLEIGRRLELSSGLIYPLIDRMVKAGVLEAEPEPRDQWTGRVQRRLIWLTPAGKQWAEQVTSRMASELRPQATP
jgi:PadR family transcriptional regulator